MARLGIFQRIRNWFLGEKPIAQPIMRPLPKYYLFNETGNILICSSAQSMQAFETNVKEAFIDVSVFFSAMTKALALHKDEKGEQGYSIFDIDAMETMFAKSGMFVETTSEQGFFVSTKVGESLGKNFIQTVLGRTFDERSLSFTRGMFSGMRKFEQESQKRKETVRSGHVFFICEVLNGLPTTSVVLVSIDRNSGEQADEQSDKTKLQLKNQSAGIDIFELGEKQERDHKNKGKQRRWIYQKRSYIFIPPNFINNASRVLNADDHHAYEDLVNKLSSHIKDVRS